MNLVKTLLEQGNKNYDVLSKPKQQLNILFLGERLRDSNSFAKQVLNSGKVTGTIVSKTHMSIDTALRLLETNLTRQFNVVVIMIGSKDVSEKTSDIAKQKLERLYELAKSDGAKVIAISNPTKKFSYGHEVRFPSNDALAQWIEKQQTVSDYIVSANSLTDSELFFEKDGITLNEQGQLIIAKQLLIALKDLGADVEYEDVEDTVIGDDTSKFNKNVKKLAKGSATSDLVDVSKLQKRLAFLGYDIDDTSELTSKKIGPATKTAIKDFQLLNGLTQSGELTPATMRVLYSGGAVNYSLWAYSNATIFGVPTNPEQKKEDEEKETARASAVTPSKNVTGFFNSIKSLAKNQETKYGIPASITMAQAAIESGWGKSQLASKYNNYFGVKCAGSSNCVELIASDGNPANWRVYSSIEASFEDHSKVLKNKRYSKAFTYPISDYKNWAKAIQNAGYAGTSGTYASALISLIEQYNLDSYSSTSSNADFDPMSAAITLTTGIDMSDLQTAASLRSYLKLPFSYTDISSLSTYPKRDMKLKEDKYFIVHHTAGRGTPQGVVGVLNKRRLGVQWIVDRDGKIYQTLPLGGKGAHILDSALGPTNSNSQGVEVIAKDDTDVLPIQAAAVFKIVKALGYSPNQIYGHGVVNPPPHRMAEEGATIVKYIKDNWNTKI